MLSLDIGPVIITSFDLSIRVLIEYKVRKMAFLSRMPTLYLGLKGIRDWIINEILLKQSEI